MPITIGRNIAALRGLRHLENSNSALSDVFGRLSSGQRINKASDDAAGLAISMSLNADQRVFRQAVRNLNDGISALRIADGALNELSGIVTRIRELAEQSANGIYSPEQRKSLDTEAQELSKEFKRIVQSTSFNGRNLLDSSYGELSLQAGYSQITSDLGGSVGDGTFTAGEIYSNGAVRDLEIGDFNRDGIDDILSTSEANGQVRVRLGNGDGTFNVNLNTTVSGSTPYSITIGDYNNDGAQDFAFTEIASQTLHVAIGNGDGTFSLGFNSSVGGTALDVQAADLNSDGFEDLVVSTTVNDAQIFMGTGNGNFTQHTTAQFDVNLRDTTIADFTGDGILDIVGAQQGGSNSLGLLVGNGDGTFSAKQNIVNVSQSYFDVEAADLNGDGLMDVIAASIAPDGIEVYLNTGGGNFASSLTHTPGNNPYDVTLGDLNGDGFLDLFYGNQGDDTVSTALGNGDGTFQARSTFSSSRAIISSEIADLNDDGALDLIAGSLNDGRYDIFLGNTQAGTGFLPEIDLTKQYKALEALVELEQVADRVNLQRGTIGAFESRINVAVNTLDSARENFAAAESRIRDTDVAVDSAELVRLGLLKQAGISVLAQANQAPTLALTLLG